MEQLDEDHINGWTSIHLHVIFGFVIRILLMLYGLLHDSLFTLKYTDVDYRVFTDASRFLSQSRSPYLRYGYRYTPIVAYMTLPNVYLFNSFGKLVFLSFDSLNGLMIYKILSSFKQLSHDQKVTAALFWLYNPLTIVVSTRGSSDSIVTFLVLLTIYYLLDHQILKSGSCLGFVVHLKLYPVIYFPAIYLYLRDHLEGHLTEAQINNPSEGHEVTTFNRFKRILFEPSLWNPFTRPRILFIVSFVLCFGLPTLWSYKSFGKLYLNEAWIYHFKRKDQQHNFSIYFYLYHVMNESKHDYISRIAFIPQAIFMAIYLRYLVFGFRPRDGDSAPVTRDTVNKLLLFIILSQSFLFVALNKVITSQYFLWYLNLFPLMVPFLDLKSWDYVKIFMIWSSSQALWLLPAYLYEFIHLQSAFFWIWISSILFLLTNIHLLTRIQRSFFQTIRSINSRADISSDSISDDGRMADSGDSGEEDTRGQDVSRSFYKKTE